jgi:hypothetical protein
MVAEGKSEEEIVAAIDENFEFVSEDAEEETVSEEKTEETVAEEKTTVVEVPVVDMKEHVEALLTGESLSEDFKAKATTILESAVNERVQVQVKVLEEAYAKALDEAVEAIKNELSENVDGYLNYVVEQWTKDNEVAIEAGLTTELTEDFISGLRNLFVEHYIDIPEDKVSVVEELGSKVKELEQKLNEEIERNVVLSKMMTESKQNEILVNACDGLTDTQAAKLKSLAEGIQFTSDNEYTTKIKTLRESYFPANSVKTDQVLDKVEGNDGKSMISENLEGPMAAYVKTLGRLTSK